MPYHARVTVTANAWVPITQGSVTGRVRMQIHRGGAIYIQAMNGAAPSGGDEVELAGTVMVEPGEGDRLSIVDDFGGVAGANQLYAKAIDAQTLVSVSHA